MRDGVSSQFVRRLARGRKFQKEEYGINRVVIDSCGEKGLVPKRQPLNSIVMSEGQNGNVDLAVQNENSGRISRSMKKKNEGGSSSKLSIGSRILCALSSMRVDKTSNIKKKDGVLPRRKCKLADVFKNIKNENEETTDNFASVKVNKEVNNGENELKQKRKRPGIIDLTAQDDALAMVHGVKLDASDDMHSTRPMIMLKEGGELVVDLSKYS